MQIRLCYERDKGYWTVDALSVTEQGNPVIFASLKSAMARVNKIAMDSPNLVSCKAITYNKLCVLGTAIGKNIAAGAGSTLLPHTCVQLAANPPTYVAYLPEKTQKNFQY